MLQGAAAIPWRGLTVSSVYMRRKSSKVPSRSSSTRDGGTTGEVWGFFFKIPREVKMFRSVLLKGDDRGGAITAVSICFQNKIGR